jgi:hypothetical protein
MDYKEIALPRILPFLSDVLCRLLPREISGIVDART